MECTLLNNDLFDDGSIECKTFIICTSENASYAEYSTLCMKRYRAILHLVKHAVMAGKRYIDVSEYKLVDHNGNHVLEIQWD